MGDVEVVLMHPLMVLIRQLPVLIRGIEGGALVSTTGAKAWIGGAHRVEYSVLAILFKENPFFASWTIFK